VSRAIERVALSSDACRLASLIANPSAYTSARSGERSEQKRASGA